VRVSDHRSLREAYVSSSAYEHWNESCLLRIKATGARLRTWGDGYGFLLVASGRVEAMVDPEAARWDLAPMPVILAEAGGRFTDFSGVATAAGGSAVATNGHVHEELLGCLRGD
jgi:histidinol-phosphatase